MKYLVGLEDVQWRQHGAPVPIVLDSDKLINGHMLIAGMSGTGKSHQIVNFLNAASSQGVECDVFDVHEELHSVRNSTAVKFSEVTRAGYNPLVLNTDHHSGGVRKQIGWMVDMVNRTSVRLGPRQESVLRNLLSEVYRTRGCMADNPASWVKREMTERQFDELTRDRRYDEMRNYYPILRDVISYTERQLKIMRTGSDQRAVAALERVEKSASRLAGINTKYHKAVSDEEVERYQTQMSAEKDKAIEAYVEFIRSIETGREMQDIHRYNNQETLVSVLERLQQLQDGGIFCSNPPDFRGSPVRVYQIGSLSDDERRLLFYVRAQQILRECMDAGQSTTVKRILLVDEGHLYYSEDSDNPMNRIAKEGRKFGLGLVIGSQSPTHFSEDFITNCGAILLTGLHEQFWDMACRKMRIDPVVLKATRAREVLSLKMHRNGEAAARFVSVNVDYGVVQAGVAKLQAQRSLAAA